MQPLAIQTPTSYTSTPVVPFQPEQSSLSISTQRGALDATPRSTLEVPRRSISKTSRHSVTSTGSKFDVTLPQSSPQRKLSVDNVGSANQELAILPALSSRSIIAATVAVGHRRVEPDERRDSAVFWENDSDELKFNWTRWFEGLVLILIAGVDNVLAYVTFATVRAFHGRLYNVVDLHLTLLPSVDIVLLGFAALGTATFVAMIALVECVKWPLFHELMNFRLFFSSLPCGVICALILYHSEKTEIAPFLTLVAVLFTICSWCFHMRVQYSYSLNILSRISLDISWFIALICGAFLVVLYFADELKVITGSDTLGCPYTPNERMPVLALVLGKWYCAKWGDSDARMEIVRAPVSNVPVKLSCADSFVSSFSVSIEPHVIECPVGCLRTIDGASSQGSVPVVGCGVYAADSSICLSAIHAGALSDMGGQAVVYGRLGASTFGRCSRNSITSDKRVVAEDGGAVSVSPPPSGGGSSAFTLPSGGRRLITTPTVLCPGGQQCPQAFHFNNLPETREFLWLKSYDSVPSTSAGVEAGKPWTRIEATVSSVLAGIILENEKVRLGKNPARDLFVQPRLGQVFSEKPAQCVIRKDGVFCNGAGSAVVELNFCEKEVKQCPDDHV